MGILQVSYPSISSTIPTPTQFSNHTTSKSIKLLRSNSQLSLATRVRLNATETAATSTPPEPAEIQEEPPSIDFAFVAVCQVNFIAIVSALCSCSRCMMLLLLQSRLLPDGTPDISMRTACGGQKLRDIMLDSNIDLYGPYVTSLPVTVNCLFLDFGRRVLIEFVAG